MYETFHISALIMTYFDPDVKRSGFFFVMMTERSRGGRAAVITHRSCLLCSGSTSRFKTVPVPSRRLKNSPS